MGRGIRWGGAWDSRVGASGREGGILVFSRDKEGGSCYSVLMRVYFGSKLVFQITHYIMNVVFIHGSFKYLSVAAHCHE